MNRVWHFLLWKYLNSPIAQPLFFNSNFLNNRFFTNCFVVQIDPQIAIGDAQIADCIVRTCAFRRALMDGIERFWLVFREKIA